MTAVFLTGATGFIGRRVLGALRHARIDAVRCLTRNPATLAAVPEMAPHWSVVAGDLLRPETYRDSLTREQIVVHLAGAVGKHRAADFERQNVDALERLVDAARSAQVRHFVYVSSIAATYPERAGSAYARSKREAERIVASAGLSHTVLRPTMVFGAGSPNLAALTRIAMLPIPVMFGRGEIQVQPIDVEDMARIIVTAALEEWNGDPVEVGGPDVVTLDDLVAAIRAVHGAPARRPVHLPLHALQRSLALVEGALMPLLPFTSGQLAAFAFPATSRPDRRVDARSPGFKDLRSMLATPLS